MLTQELYKNLSFWSGVSKKPPKAEDLTDEVQVRDISIDYNHFSEMFRFAHAQQFIKNFFLKKVILRSV